MSGFLNNLSDIQKEVLKQFNEYLNKEETINSIKSEIKEKSKSNTTVTNTDNEENDKLVTIWNINLKESSKQRDIILLKFLRAREFKFENAKQMLIDCLVWRSQNNIDNILNEEFPEVYKEIGEIYKTDKEGRPVMINYYSNIIPDQLFKDQQGIDQFVRWKVQQMERAIQTTLIPSNWEIEDLIVIHNYKDCSFFRMDSRIKQASNLTITTLQNNYPETLARKFFINIPWLLSKLFNIFSALASERTKSKFILCSDSYRESLLKYIQPDCIAPKLSGFDDNKLPIENIKLSKKSHTIQLGNLDDDKTIEWEFTSSEIGQEIGANILFNSNNEITTNNDQLYNGTTSTTTPNEYTSFLLIKPKEFNSGSIQVEDKGYYTFVFNNELLNNNNKPIDLYYRISTKSKTTHSTTTTTTNDNLLS